MRAPLLLSALALAPSCLFAGGDPAAEATAALRQLPTDLRREGPAAWLAWFEPSDRFFMATYGGLEFDGHDAAVARLRALAATVTGIDLALAPPRVDVLDPNTVTVGVAYRERIEFVGRDPVDEQGYLTGVLRRSGGRWRFVHLHWSTPQVVPTAP